LWQEFGEQFASGQLQPCISQVLSWQQADTAHQLLGSNQIAGKLVLSID
jgi:NADPH:quinone reductase-like Zn-dependent oxidoreductase